MKRFTFKAAVSLLFTFFVCILPSAVCAQNPKMIDSFDQKEDGIKYSSYHGETVLNQEGYGIFYERADATLSRVTLKESDKALRIQYDLPPLGYGDNWISIRKDFASAFDLTEYDGLELDIKAEVPSDAILRITLADVEKAEDVMKWGEDELWWFDADRGVLSKTEWQTIQVPFEKLRSSYGYGTRHNNGKKDLSLVVGYELNLISRKSRQNLKGAVLVNNVRAYRESM